MCLFILHPSYLLFHLFYSDFISINSFILYFSFDSIQIYPSSLSHLLLFFIPFHSLCPSIHLLNPIFILLIYFFFCPIISSLFVHPSDLLSFIYSVIHLFSFVYLFSSGILYSTADVTRVAPLVSPLEGKQTRKIHQKTEKIKYYNLLNLKNCKKYQMYNKKIFEC